MDTESWRNGDSSVAATSGAFIIRCCGNSLPTQRRITATLANRSIRETLSLGAHIPDVPDVRRARAAGGYTLSCEQVRIPDEDVSIALSPSRKVRAVFVRDNTCGNTRLDNQRLTPFSRRLCKGLGAGGGAALAAVEPTDISGFGTGSTVEAGPML